MANEILRMNYFDGLKLYQDEFIKEQNYHIRMRRLHNRRLHTWGIVWGMNVEQKNPTSTNEHTIRITEGMAFNQVKKNYINEDLTFNEEVSEEIVNLDDNYEIDLRTVTPQLTLSDVYVYATYFEAKSSGTGTIVDKYWKETARIEASNNEPTDEKEYILLAKVTYDLTTKTITGIDDTVPTARAPSSGAFTGSIETETLKLKLDPLVSGDYATIYGSKLSQGPSLPDIYGIQVDSPKTEFTGPLKIKNDVEITGNLKLSNTSTVEGITPAKIDPLGVLTVAQINAGNSVILKKNIDPTVGGSGWVKLPFLPKKYSTITTTGLITDYREFKLSSGFSFCDNGNSGVIPPILSGAHGIMEFSIPPQATKIIGIGIAGSKNDEYIGIKLYRGKFDSATNEYKVEEIFFNNSDIIGPGKFKRNNYTINPVYQSLDKEWTTLAFYVRASKAAEISFIAIQFE